MGTSKQRVIILDVSHLFYKYAFGAASALSATIDVNGMPTRVDTTLPAYSIKQIHRWANGGFNPTAVCFDGKGSSRSRKAYFAAHNGLRSGAEAVGYKGNREIQDNRFYEGVELTYNILQQGGVRVLRKDGYEADDLVKAAVDSAKQTYPDLPIDVITGDQDLVPLVDEQVSVFLTSRKMTWAKDKDIEKRNYVQLTPDNYQEYMQGLTNYNKLIVPYNTILLTKLLRGDKSDEIPGYPKLTPTKYNNIIKQMIDDDVDFANTFRYDTQVPIYCHRSTKEPIPEDEIVNTPKEQMMITYSEPKALTEICNVLSNYVDDDVIDHVRFVYNGINLNCAFTDVPEQFKRPPLYLSTPIQTYLAPKLQQKFEIIKAKLPII